MPDHHAVLYIGDSLATTSIDVTALKTITELEIMRLPVLSIGAVRQLIMSAYVRPFERPTKTIVLEVGQIAPEAQQALLKVLEEPPATTKFILVMPSTKGLLATVLSRLFVVENTQASAPGATSALDTFMAQTYSERINTISDIAKAKDSAEFEVLSRELALWLGLHPALPAQVQARLHDWLLVLSNRGSSKKMLWEDIALVLPVLPTRPVV